MRLENTFHADINSTYLYLNFELQFCILYTTSIQIQEHISFCYAFFRSITRAYYRNSVGGLLLFDITNRRSFQNVHEWLEEARSHVQPHSIVFLLVGHKCDLEPQRQVSRQEAEKLAAAYGMRYVETSARDAINVERAFTELTRDIFELVKNGEITIQEGWEGVKSGFVPNVVHSSEEVTKGDRRCFCWVSNRHPVTYQHLGPGGQKNPASSNHFNSLIMTSSPLSCLLNA